MTSQAAFNRFTSDRNKSALFSLRSAARRSSSEYTLQELEPLPESALSEEGLRPRLQKPAHSALAMRPSPPSSWDDRANSFGSTSKTKPRLTFAGPPPPIASSRILGGSTSRGSPSHVSSPGVFRKSTGSFFDRREQDIANRPDSIWRGLQRQERALEREIQQLLDLQANGLIAGSKDIDDRSQNGTDGDSEAGSGTFYSTATSRSQMVNSLHVPIRSTPNGDVIPVRQPISTKPSGLRSARAGLKESMAAMADLKAEEDAHVDAAITQRKDALAYLRKLSTKRQNIFAELRLLEEDGQEPLGQELRELGSEHDSLTREIHELETKLSGMRNRRRWLREKMEDVKNRRDAGLSGYRAAGRDIDAEVQSLMKRPPVTPLDVEALGSHLESKDVEAPGGPEFLKLRPERRTAEMAQNWWQSEVDLLERRRAQIAADREALEQGAQVWEEVIQLVADFESSLRGAVKAGGRLGRDDDLDQEPTETSMYSHLTKMDAVISELEERLQAVEQKHWNLLICAIGAELEAFVEARRLLKSTLGESDKTPSPSTVNKPGDQDGDRCSSSNEHHDESDNEVPPDLLISHFEDRDDSGPVRRKPTGILERRESENNTVPPEFLVEHEQDTQ